MEFYYAPVSSPCRAVLLLFQALNVNPEMKLVDMNKGEHMTPEYLKMNPQHSIPVLVDGTFVLSESRAILGYLAEAYGGDDQVLYPSDPMARGVVNQRLNFDLGTLYQSFLNAYLVPALTGGAFEEPKKDKLLEALNLLEIFIGDSQYMAGDKMTIADFAIAASIASIESVGVDISGYPKIATWYELCKHEMSNFEDVNTKGAEMLGSVIKGALNL